MPTTPESDLYARIHNRGGGRIYDSTAFGDLGIAADGTTDDTAALQALVDDIDAAGGGVLLVPAEHAIEGQLSVPSTVVTAFVPGGRLRLLSATPAASVAFGAPIEAERIFIFDVASGASVSFAQGVQDSVFPEWWGAEGNARYKSAGSWYADAAHTVAAGDDTAAVNAALAAAAGRCLDVSGRHLFTGQLSVPGDIRVASRQRGGFVEGTRQDYCLYASGQSHIVFDGIYLEGLGTAQGATSEERGLFFTGCSDVAVRNCEITQITVGAYFQNCTDWRFEDNYVHDIKTRTDLSEGYGVITTSPGGAGFNTNWAIARNVFHDIERHAVYVSSGSSNGVVADNVIRTCWSVGIHLYATSSEPAIQNVTISGNSITDIASTSGSVAPWGIGGTGNMTGLTITGNSIAKTESGIYLQGDASYATSANPTGLTIVGNTIDNPNSGSGLGIAVYNAQDVQIESNTVLSPTGTGIIASVSGTGTGSYLSRVTIAGNEVVGAGSYGINVSGAARVADVVLGRNTLKSCTSGRWNIPADTIGAVQYDLPVTTFHFARTAVASSLSGSIIDGPLAGVSYYPAPSGRKGYVVGIAATASGSISAGTATVKIVKDGTVYGTYTTQLSSSAQTAATSIPPGAFAWLPAERLGAALDTSADFAPSGSRAITVVMTVMYDAD